MALKIRLRQQGRNNSRSYRLVITESRAPRDGKYIEMIGFYNPSDTDPERGMTINKERLQHWIAQGAEMTEKVRSLAKRAAPEVITHLVQQELQLRAKEASKRKSAKAAK